MSSESDRGIGKQNVNYILRTLELRDCPQVLEIYAQAGFWIYKYANEMMHQIDHDGLIVAEDLHNGKILGLCSAVNVSPELGFIGQYAVRNECQGLGIGSALWRKAMKHIGPDRNVSLYSAPLMVDKYKNNGFVVNSGIEMHYYSGKHDCNQLIESIEGISVIPINDKNITKVIEYDRRVSNGIDRSLLIELLVKGPDTQTAVAVDQNQEVVGYAVICISIARKGRTDQIYADNGSIAELLLGYCCRSLASRGITELVYRCWDCNKSALDLAKKLNLEFEGKDPLLFTKSVFEVNKEKIFSPSCGAFYPF